MKKVQVHLHGNLAHASLLRRRRRWKQILIVTDFDIILRKRTKISTATDRADEEVLLTLLPCWSIKWGNLLDMSSYQTPREVKYEMAKTKVKVDALQKIYNC